MIIRCAWCKRIIGNKPPYGGKWDREVTDGICPDCMRKYFGKVMGNKEDSDVREDRLRTSSGD